VRTRLAHQPTQNDGETLVGTSQKECSLQDMGMDQYLLIQFLLG
jgi:hypothetical protein